MSVFLRILFLCLVAPVVAAQDTAGIDGPDIDPGVSEKPRKQPRALADQLLLDSTSIRGSRELPRVMYIVPWKDPQLGEVVGKPVNSLVDEVLAPVDRDVFLRQTKYFNQLYGPQISGDGQ